MLVVIMYHWFKVNIKKTIKIVLLLHNNKAFVFFWSRLNLLYETLSSDEIFLIENENMWLALNEALCFKKWQMSLLVQFFVVAVIVPIFHPYQSDIVWPYQQIIWRVACKTVNIIDFYHSPICQLYLKYSYSHITIRLVLTVSTLQQNW